MSQDTTMAPTVSNDDFVHDIVPNYNSPLELNIRAYIDTIPTALPSPTVQDPLYGRISPLLSPSQENSLSIHGFLDELNQAPDDELLAEPNQPTVSKTCSRLVLFRSYISHCLVLQSSANISERKPLTKKLSSELDKKYAKMRQLAFKAQQQAEALERRDLKARSEYWSGRACGGLRDWETAVKHFAVAIKLDVRNPTDKHIEPFREGLLPDEKNDVDFLLQYVTQRRDEWAQRKDKEEKRMHLQGFYIEDIDWEALKDPHWTPHRDFMMYSAKQQHSGVSGKPVNHVNSSADQWRPVLHDIEIRVVNQKLAVQDDKQYFRHTLTAEEWKYILRGDENTKKNLLRVQGMRKGKIEHKREISFLPSPRSIPSTHSSPKMARDLCSELEQAGFNSDEEEDMYGDDDEEEDEDEEDLGSEMDES
ncbi:uncharacterized protein SETTUDRAFT_31380 [Exserohilum turcica Et28A]|uniref:Uncharacterized protein n=1 Tax=Exserohilum turcicum (strain 28A) TaxID=671987 RepID=R0KCI6_EXST2|nr:uncharacterized protein SETTUDRAFT_31380 [Exserohilum turcica Et28A]EOA87079.1 hypothetical protein SETTUDRAFT_31380 [Exserohilum turcica Et28A]